MGRSPEDHTRAAPGAPARAAARWILGVAALTFVLSIGTPLFGLRVFSGADMLLDRAPWRTGSPLVREASNPIVGDTVSTFMPLHAEFRRRLFDGDLPLWTALPAGGLPLGSVPDAGALGPLNLPYRIVPLSYAPGLAKLLELATAMGFTFLFLRRIGLSRVASLAGGLVYAMSGFQIVWTNWPQGHVGALIPALFWTVERALQERRPWSGLPVSLVVAAMVFEGFPSVTGYALLASAAYAVVRAVVQPGLTRRYRMWALGLVVGAAILGLGLSALQALPLADRAAELDLGYRLQSPDSHLPPSALVTLGIPNAFGSPVDDSYWGPLNYVEIQGFIGASSLVAVAAAAAWRAAGTIVRGAGSFLWATTAVASLLLFVGGPLLELLQNSALFGLNFVGRLRSVLGFALAALAAIGLEALVQRRRTDPGPPRRAAAVWVVVALLGALGLWRLWVIADGAGRGADLLRASVLPVAAAGVALASVWVARSVPRAGWAVWVLPGVFAVEALAVSLPFWPRIARDEFYPTTPAHVMLSRRLGADRLVGASGAMFPGTTTFYGLRSLTTNNTLPQLPSWEDLIVQVDPDAFDQSPVFPSLAARPDVATSPVLDRLSVRYIVAPPNLPVFGRRVRLASPTSDRLVLGPGDTASRTLPGGGPWRAVLVPVAAPLEVPEGARMAAEIHDASGGTIAAGEQYVFAGDGPGMVQVLVPEATCGPGCATPLTVEISLDAPSGRAVLAAAGDGGPALSLVERTEDGLLLDVTANVAGYRRLHALPRIRWAAKARVAPSAEERIELLADGLPPDLVLLSEPGPLGSGEQAEIRALEDSGDEIHVRVAATGGGYLVVADPLQDGWVATLDGRSTSLREADHAVVAVFVPAGEHDVALRYDPSAWRLGQAVSAASLAILGIVGLIAARRRRPRDHRLPTSRRAD